MATTHTYSGLTDAVEVRRDELIVKASLGAPSLKTFDIYTDIKGKQLIPSLDTSITFGDGSNCQFEATGSDVWGEVELDPKDIKVNKSWCFRSMAQKFEAWNNRVAIGLEKVPYEDQFIQNQLNAIDEALDIAIWSGNTTVGLSGITQQLDASSATTINVSGLTSASTIGEKVDAVVASIPAKAFKAGRDGKVRVYMSNTDFSAYIKGLNAQCCGKVGLIDAAVDELAYPGDSRVLLTPVPGLEGLGYIVAVPAESLAYGTDVEGSENIFDLYQDRKDRNWIFNVLFRAAVAVKMPFYTVVYKA